MGFRKDISKALPVPAVPGKVNLCGGGMGGGGSFDRNIHLGIWRIKRRVSWAMSNEKLSLCATRRLREGGLMRGLVGRPN